MVSPVSTSSTDLEQSLDSLFEVPGLVPKLSSFWPYKPHPKQLAFLLLPHDEVLYGGAAGGGKTDALLFAALQYVDVPGYSAVVFRRTYPQLHAASGLVARSKAWLSGSDAVWSESKCQWTFPSGATLKFNHLKDDNAVYDHQGPEYQCVVFDELTQFTRHQYTYLLSRLRRPKEGPLSRVPLRCLSGSNPGGLGHAWVKRRFVDVKPNPTTCFLPAKLEDNPSLDTQEYDRQLQKLGPVQYERLRFGNWNVEEGTLFNRLHFKYVAAEDVPADVEWARYWDLAASLRAEADFVTSARVGFDSLGNLYVADLVEFKGPWPLVSQELVRLGRTEWDRYGCKVGVESNGFQLAAWQQVASDRKLRGVVCEPVHVSRSKVERAQPWASLTRQGRTYLVGGEWVEGFLDQVTTFPEAKHDDRVDTVSGGVLLLSDFESGNDLEELVEALSEEFGAYLPQW